MGSWAHHVQESFKNTLGVSTSFDVHYYDEDVSESNTRNQNGPRGSFRHSIRKSFRLVPGQQQLSCGPPRLYTQPQASTRVRSEVMRVLNLAVTDPFRSGSGWLMWSWFFTTLFLLHTASALGLAWYLIFTPTFACYPRRTRLLWGSYQIFKVTCSVTNWITASILRRRTQMAALCRSQVFVAHLLRCYTIVCVALIGPAFIMMVSLGLASDVVGFFGVTVITVLQILPAVCFFPYIAVAMLMRIESEDLQRLVRVCCASAQPQAFHKQALVDVRLKAVKWSMVLIPHCCLEFGLLVSCWGALAFGFMRDFMDFLDLPCGPLCQGAFSYLILSVSVFHVFLAFIIVQPIAEYNSFIESCLDDADVEGVTFKLLYYRPLSIRIFGLYLSRSQFRTSIRIAMSLGVFSALQFLATTGSKRN